jgi:hypothetical protein
MSKDTQQGCLNWNRSVTPKRNVIFIVSGLSAIFPLDTESQAVSFLWSKGRVARDPGSVRDSTSDI